MPVLEKLHNHGCERDTAGNRKLHYDQYAALILLYFFNPIVTSLRGIVQASGLKKSLTRLGIHPRIVRRVSIATYEAEMNTVIFTSGGHITAYVKPGEIRVEIVDSGPGIPDIEQAMQPGFSTAPHSIQELGFGAGMGLPNIKKCSDKMNINSVAGKGTKLEIIIHTQEKK